MLCQDRRQSANHIFNTFVRRQQSEGKQYGLPLAAKEILEVVGVGEWNIGHAMRDNIDSFGGDSIHLAQKKRGMLAHDDQAIRKLSQLVEDGALIGIRFA